MSIVRSLGLSEQPGATNTAIFVYNDTDTDAGTGKGTGTDTDTDSGTAHTQTLIQPPIQVIYKYIDTLLLQYIE